MQDLAREQGGTHVHGGAACRDGCGACVPVVVARAPAQANARACLCLGVCVRVCVWCLCPQVMGFYGVAPGPVYALSLVLLWVAVAE
jgi:hypothetical protein